MKFILFLLPFLLFANKPKLLLLKTYKDQNISDWVMSEKLDGIRAYWDGKNLISRGGKIINAPKWFIKNFPPFEIDGELWTKRGDFEHIISIVRDKTPTDEWKKITYNIFKVPHTKGGLFERLVKVKSFKDAECKVIGYNKGKNKYKDMLGSIICQMDDITFNIGSGFSDKERENPPSIGSIITFKYKSLTRYKKPRFPVFIRIRYEK